MICQKCQTANPETSRFCGSCGADLSLQQQADPPQFPQGNPAPAYYQPVQPGYPPAIPPAYPQAQIPFSLRSQFIGACLVLLGIFLPWYSLGYGILAISGFDILQLGFNVSRYASLLGIPQYSSQFLLSSILLILIILAGLTGIESFTGSQRGRSRARRAGWIGILMMIGLGVLLFSQIPLFPGVGFFVTAAGLVCMIILGRK